MVNKMKPIEHTKMRTEKEIRERLEILKKLNDVLNNEIRYLKWVLGEI